MTIVGIDQVARRLLSVAAAIPVRAGAALFQEAQIERAESMRRTPVDTSALRGSHEVIGPMYRGRDISVSIQVGGAAAPYAIPVHENLEAFHPKGGQAKFLESTINESRPHIVARVARRMGGIG